MRTFIRFVQLVSSDADRLGHRHAGAVAIVRLTFRHPGFLATTLLRGQQVLNERRRFRFARVLRYMALSLTGADFVPGFQVGPGLLIRHPSGIVLGAGVIIGRNCTILQNVTLGERNADGRAPHEYPAIEDSVTIGAGACVLGRVHIGANAIIGANAVVVSDVPSGALAIGIPARAVESTSPRLGTPNA